MSRMHIFYRSLSKLKNVRKYSSCNYDEPLVFGPMFSAFFFGGLYTGLLMGTVKSSHNILLEKLEKIDAQVKYINNEVIKK